MSLRRDPEQWRQVARKHPGRVIHPDWNPNPAREPWTPREQIKPWIPSRRIPRVGVAR